jgi:hypothetical protein
VCFYLDFFGSAVVPLRLLGIYARENILDILDTEETGKIDTLH